MKSVVTIKLDNELDKMLSQVSRKLKKSRSEVIRDSLRRQLSIYIFNTLQEQALPQAEKKGYLTDEDVSREIS